MRVESCPFVFHFLNLNVELNLISYVYDVITMCGECFVHVGKGRGYESTLIIKMLANWLLFIKKDWLVLIVNANQMVDELTNGYDWFYKEVT